MEDIKFKILINYVHKYIVDVLEKNNIEINHNKISQRLYNTYCYCNKTKQKLLQFHNIFGMNERMIINIYS